MKKYLKIILITVMCLTVSVALFAGGKKNKGDNADGGKQITVAFCFQNLESEFWGTSYQIITKMLVDQGVKSVDFEANESATQQLQQVKDAITSGVDGVIIIPQDGQSAITIAQECNEAGVPLLVWVRPPSNDSRPCIVSLSKFRPQTYETVKYMVKVAMEKYEKTGKKLTPANLVGDLGDPNAVERLKGYYDAINEHPEIFNLDENGKAIEIPTKWDENLAVTNLNSAFRAHPEIDFLAASSDLLIKGMKAGMMQNDKWHKIGDPKHVICCGMDGDATAYTWIKEGWMDADAAMNLQAMADVGVSRLLEAIENGEKAPKDWFLDPGFALTQENYLEMKEQCWGYQVLKARGEVD